jgi:hypothetical protein
LETEPVTDSPLDKKILAAALLALAIALIARAGGATKGPNP